MPLLIALASLSLSRSGIPTAVQILASCQKAYDSVRTFEQDVSSVSGGMKGSAHIIFSRPGNLRAGGQSLFGQKYDLIVKGNSASVYNVGSWSDGQTAEMGLATVTGLSGMAPTPVSAFLLHTKWGALASDADVHYKVHSDKVGDADTFRLDADKPWKSSIWIDKKTRFLVKTKIHIMNSDVGILCSPAKVNLPIPFSRFKK